MPQVGIQNVSFNFGFGKRKQRSQMCELFTIDGRILTVEHDVVRGCMDDENKGKGFLIDETNQMTAEDGNWTQILGENSVLPLPLVTNKPYVKDEEGTTDDSLRKLVDQIYHESAEAAKLQCYIQSTKRVLLDKLSQIVAIPCVAFLIIFAANYFKK